jgi:hypothetical protein
MPPPDASSTDPQVVVFSVPQRVVLIRRGSEIALGAYALVMIALFFPWTDPLPPDSIDHIVWPILAVGVAVPAAFVWFRWKRIPRGAPGGRLQIGPDGIAYQVGPDHVGLSWPQVAGVYPITMPSKPQVGAIWLPNEDPAAPGSSRMTLLGIAHAKSPYRPILQPDGLLLSLDGFESSFEPILENIIKTLQRCLENQGKGGD